VTKGKLLTLLGILTVIELALAVLSLDNFVISYLVGLLIYFIIISPPMLFLNYKLFTIARRSRRNNVMSSEKKKSFSLETVSSCLLAVACFVALSIPSFIYIGLRITSKNEDTLDDAEFVRLWAKTVTAMNSTFNCLIFYWKNKTLRTAGMKVVKSMKIRRKVQSQPARADHRNKTYIRCREAKKKRGKSFERKASV
jgi:hypothetical protein